MNPSNRVDELLDDFNNVIGVACGKLKEDWGKFDTDTDTRVFMLKNMLVSAMSASLAGMLHYSDDEYVEACVRVAKSLVLEISRQELICLVVQTRAEALDFNFPYRGETFLFQNSTRYLDKRIEAVKNWSRDSAFIFGADAIDDLIGGVQPGEICALTGAQGSMKTSFVLSGVENALSRNMHVAFFSLDMAPGELQERRVMRRLNCSQKTLHRMIRDGEPCVAQAMQEMNDVDRDIFDLEGNDAGQTWSIDELFETVKRRPPHVLVIDYLTLLRRRGQSDLDSVNETMPVLKGWTQRLGLRTILLSQMSRAGKGEQQKGVIGGHAKGGGIIEELAHSEIELFKDKDPDRDAARIVATVTKNRRGPSGRSYQLDYFPESMTFTGCSTRVQPVGKNANKAAFENMVPPMSWGNAHAENIANARSVDLR